jgi:protein translocase SecG subunit
MNTTLHSVAQMVQIISSTLIIITVCFQQSDASLGSFSGDTGSGVKFTRRGFEKFLYRFTVFLGILFILASVFVILK